MKGFMRVVGTVALTGFAVLPAMAANVETMTCGEFGAMDAPGKLAAATDLLQWIDTSENSELAGCLIAKYTECRADDPWTPANMVLEIEGHCKDTGADMNVIARLKEHS